MTLFVLFFPASGHLETRQTLQNKGKRKMTNRPCFTPLTLTPFQIRAGAAPSHAPSVLLREEPLAQPTSAKTPLESRQLLPPRMPSWAANHVGLVLGLSSIFRQKL